jgi:CRISPR-associated protein Csb2
MPTIAIRFPAGRYHATPWGSHVNEGLVEWPPSPWRVLRALLATGFAKLGWLSVPDEARRMVYELAQAVPSYRLPSGELAHTRHYMPIIEGRTQNTTKVLDTFVRLSPDDDLLIHYPIQLSPSSLAMLERLAPNLGYFGRAESWADGRLTADVPVDAHWCTPSQPNLPPPPDRPGGDQVSLIAPLAAIDYDCWRQQALARPSENEGKKPTKKQLEKLTAPYPADLLQCLLTDTAFHHKHGWSQPPGSRLVLYNRPPGMLEPRPARPAPRRAHVRPVQAALLALASDTVSGDLLPLMTRCLPQAELLHQALLSALGQDASACPAISGRDAEGKPLQGHRHAHYMPMDLDEDGRMDHVLVYASMGLDAAAQAALAKVRRTWTKGSDKDIFVTFAGMGDLDLFRRKLRTRGGRSPAILGTTRAWSSLTPFVPPRHIKKSRCCLEDQVRSELSSRGLPDPLTVEYLDREEIVRRGLLRFVRLRRPGKPQPPRPNAFGLRLTFAQPVPGPIALGYAAHYGLGLFAAEETP